jgi:hypothetical protein
MKIELIKEIAVTLEYAGTVLSIPAMDMLVEMLDKYPEGKIRQALAECRDEIRGRITPADIVSRIRENDGRPTADEAWAMLPRSEEQTVVWTDEMSASYGVASHMMESDRVAARMSFISAYNTRVAEARGQASPVRWTATLGTYEAGRDHVVMDAVRKGRLSPPQARVLCPELPPMAGEAPMLEQSTDHSADVRKFVAKIEEQVTLEKDPRLLGSVTGEK